MGHPAPAAWGELRGYQERGDHHRVGRQGDGVGKLLVLDDDQYEDRAGR
jgi:hypothetical protein